MTEVTDKNFGLLIAYLIPGFLTLAGLSEVFVPVSAWLGLPPEEAPTIGGFLYATLASIAVGLLLSALRWLLLDPLHHWTGVRPRPWDFSALPGRLPAFEGVVENHYRYYQSFGNGLIGLLLVLGFGRPLPIALGSPSALLVFLSLVALLYIASRDALKKYHQRAQDVLGPTDHW